ncbi:hypothetical protein DYI21_09780 [Thalassospira tepidiphila]|nr:hypothetical protein [Thalassospira tepidiphila]
MAQPARRIRRFRSFCPIWHSVSIGNSCTSETCWHLMA